MDISRQTGFATAKQMRKAIALCAAFMLGIADVSAQENEHSVVVELAGAGEWSFHGDSAYGPDIALEVTVVQHMLEIEIGAAPLFSKGQAEIGTDLLFKKPYELSEQLEVSLGIGPEWIHRTGGEGQTDSIAAEATLTLVYSPWPKSPVSLFVEPAYSYDFGKGHEQAIGVATGLHIAIK